MSAKYFCDACGVEFVPRGRLYKELGDVRVETIISYKRIANDGHICPACIIKTVNEGKDYKP